VTYKKHQYIFIYYTYYIYIIKQEYKFIFSYSNDIYIYIYIYIYICNYVIIILFEMSRTTIPANLIKGHISIRSVRGPFCIKFGFNITLYNTI